MLKGRQFYLIRLKKGISREELAKRLGVTSNEITIYENGVREIPDDLYGEWIKNLN